MKKVIKLLEEFLQTSEYNKNKLNALLESGLLNGSFSDKDIEAIFTYLTQHYKDYVTKAKIGETFKGLPLYVYYIHTKQSQYPINDSTFKVALTDNQKVHLPGIRKGKILFTGIHHARELLCTNMIVKIAVECIHGLMYDMKEQQFWKYTDIALVPIINLDGYKFISDSFGTPSWQKYSQKRKNMNPNFCQEGGQVQMGVDLNRNYGYHFGEDGETKERCTEVFRGPNAFSEKETQAIQNLVTNDPDINAAINLHTFGNMWLHPYNYSKRPDFVPPTMDPQIIKFYKDFQKVVHSKSKAAYGNAIKYVQYFTEGEASDWMLGEHNIIAISAELGSSDPQAQTFQIPQNLITKVLEENYSVIKSFIEQSVFKMTKLNQGFDSDNNFFIKFYSNNLVNMHNVKVEISSENYSFIDNIESISMEERDNEQKIPFEKTSNGNLLTKGIIFVIEDLKRLEFSELYFKMKDKYNLKQNLIVNFSLKTEEGTVLKAKVLKFNFFYIIRETPNLAFAIIILLLIVLTLMIVLIIMKSKKQQMSKDGQMELYLASKMDMSIPQDGFVSEVN